MPIIKTDKDLKDRQPLDFYPTPAELAWAMVDLAAPNPRSVLDPGMGTGIFGLAVHSRYPNAWITGIDIKLKNAYLPVYDFVVENDFTIPEVHSTPYDPDDCYDLIIGNPPYKFAEEFVRRSLSLLSPDGELIFLLRIEFLASQGRFSGLWREYPPQTVYVCSARPSFTNDNHTDATDYAVYCWNNATRRRGTTLRWLQWKTGEKL